MAQQFEFGMRNNSNPLTKAVNQKLQHYRLQIQKLQQLNIEQQQAYTRKIASLQLMLKQQGGNNQNNGSQMYAPYQSAGTTSMEILKRDREINRLSEENQRLIKQVHANPDHQLLGRKRGYFDQAADKDAQILRLKKCIYQLETKFDGKISSDARWKNEYAILQQQNQKLRKHLQFYSQSTSRSQGTELNPQLLQGLRYKKQSQLLAQQNQHLKRQYGKLEDQYNIYRENMSKKGLLPPMVNNNGMSPVIIGSNTEAQILKRDLNQTYQRNKLLMDQNKELQIRNSTLTNQAAAYSPSQVMEKRYGEQGNNYSGSDKKRRHHIFQARQTQPFSPQQSQMQSQYQSEIVQQQPQYTQQQQQQQPDQVYYTSNIIQKQLSSEQSNQLNKLQSQQRQIERQYQLQQQSSLQQNQSIDQQQYIQQSQSIQQSQAIQQPQSQHQTQSIQVPAIQQKQSISSSVGQQNQPINNSSQQQQQVYNNNNNNSFDSIQNNSKIMRGKRSLQQQQQVQMYQQQQMNRSADVQQYYQKIQHQQSLYPEQNHQMVENQPVLTPTAIKSSQPQNIPNSSINGTQKKSGAYYDRFGLNELTKRSSLH